ncbi:Asp/Glu racemase [Aliishimia ponticola]|uniref:Asp/Glu racemase n=1 Tax=Aliishimia ponticola TaxID=2499833 RepID=A0A4S4NH99_9RHOB|nr:aspartate/glutamate racemase family protein [Aliishimia ponticola]THH38037.1 Asp/Glu racemase [Aliishimia ponticola]
MAALHYDLIGTPRKAMGLVVLQTDETIETELRQILPRSLSLFVNRVPSAPEVTRDTLARMEAHLTGAAALLPGTDALAVTGYGCTSGTAQIGQARIAELIHAGVRTAHVTEPVSALIAACRQAGLTRLAFLSPYVEEVSAHLRSLLADQGIATPVFGSFEEADEARVARIAPAAIARAANNLVQGAGVDAVFLSCTNLRSFEIIPGLQDSLGLPVLSSNLVIGWHMLRLAQAVPPDCRPGDLLT